MDMAARLSEGLLERSSCQLPRGLRHPWDLAIVGELAQTDAAHAELAIHRARTPAAAAASICTRFELRFARLLDALRCLSHQSLPSFSSASSEASAEGSSWVASAWGSACAL